MQLQTINRTDAEKIFGSHLNNQGATMTTGYAVCFTTTVASVDGNKSVLPAAGQLATFAGISDSDLADNTVGRYQCYGYTASVFYAADATSVSLTAAGHGIGPGPASLGCNVRGLSFALGPVVTLESVGAIIRSAGGYIQGFTRAL